MVGTTTSCATCAQYLHTLSPDYNEKGEKPKERKNDRNLDCCSRVICGKCIQGNTRFGNYCPFCQISTLPSPLPQGLRDPPTTPLSSKTTSSTAIPPLEVLPPYRPSANSHFSPLNKQPAEPVSEDTLHFLNHTTDTLIFLSLRYNVPIHALRSKNNINSDHLVLARQTILIPGEFYKGGVSLSPRPVEGEEEERRKAIVRRWMVGCKVSEYDTALLYLQQTSYDLEAAILAYKDDEKWEKDHPLEAGKKQKGKQKHDLGTRRFTSQRS